MPVSFMERIVAYCGIVCSDCPVLTATQKNDNQERQKVADMFTKQYDREYKPNDINCDGCLTDGPRIFSYCGICKIRKCAKEKKVENCAFCSGYPCGMLSELHTAYSKAKDTLDAVRRQRGLS
jgi:hypothetical protein